MVEIKQQIVSKAIQKQVTYGGTNGRKTLTVHQTGNTKKGAGAAMHAKLQSNGNSRAASWMIQSDDKDIIQSFPFTAQTWHAGDGRGNGNLNSISWEICINVDSDYVKSLELAAKGIAQVLKQHNLTVNDLRQHHDWSGKNCPAQIRAGQAGITWNDFKYMVTIEMGNKLSPKPITETTPVQSNQTAYTGSSIVDYLVSVGQDSSPEARAKLAKDKGVNNYTGTAAQNTQLLNMLRSEGNAQAVKPSSTPNPSPKKTAQQVAEEIYKGEGDWGDNPGRKQKLIERGYSYSEVQSIVNQLASRSKTTSTKAPASFKVGDKVTASQLYGTSNAESTARKSAITGYVEKINNGWRNPYRLVKTKGETDYLGFARKSHLKK